MDLVEAPEPRQLMEEAVHGVLAEIGHDQHAEELERVRLARHEGLELGRRRPAEEQGSRGHGEQDRHLDEQVAHTEVP